MLPAEEQRHFQPPGCEVTTCAGNSFVNGAFSPQVERFLQLQLHLFPILNSWVSASNVSHTVVLRPLKAGYFNFTSATITYLAQEDGPVVIGFTSAPGQGGILAQREFDRRFSPHFLDWAAFGVMTLPSIGIPLLLWYSSKRKYDTPKTKKN
ncbi:translocon-associated protein subunit beta isoform X2 [Equus quagga]|uniref:translocon-associated protein subunit beta isoform X2 n=1 Tax=Equus quagga TaxID=89248 RepID=UPI001EE2A324|nr:translocon-associated protein subunit beta isoform X2 [Equus quagga]